MLTKLILCIAICATATSALAQAKRHPRTKPLITQAEGDTLKMSCAQAASRVRSAGSIILKTGPNRFDLYVKDGAACTAQDEDTVPAFVSTKDNYTCHIGYTCEVHDED
jgi:hypothetical protein